VLFKALAEIDGGVGVMVESSSAARTLLDSCPLALLAGLAAAVGELGGVVLVQENDLAHTLEVASESQDRGATANIPTAALAAMETVSPYNQRPWRGGDFCCNCRLQH